MSQLTNEPPLRLALRGESLLTSPRFNKGAGFPASERRAFGLIGRLPYRTNTLDEQCERAYEQLNSRDSAIRKNTFLQSLKDQNWTLYYSLLARHLKELVPVIYTPTEAEAIANYSHLFRRSEGLYLTFPSQERMEEDFLEQTEGRVIDLFVCTDSEAILGIGDQGVGISTAKSVMYTLVGGLDPSRSVSVVLDVGTNNKELLNDPLYVGWPSKRVRGEEYDKFINKFVQLVRKYHPHSLLHFEDFGVTNAHRLLDRYRESHAAFNDDIQGTGAVTLACIMAAIGISSRSSKSGQGKRLSDQRYVILGAGSAGMGIAVQLRDAMVADDGVSRAEANRRFWLVDRQGLLYDSSTALLLLSQADSAERREFIRPLSESWEELVEGEETIGLLEVVKRVKPTVLIGCSTAAGAFTEDVVKAMVAGLQEEDPGARPIITPLSNPSRLVEATPENIIHWTEGRALVATGSPFDSVHMEKKEIAECNNALIYPGLGFGAILSQSRQMTDRMLIAGARRLAALSPAITLAVRAEEKGEGYEYNGEALLPDFGEAPEVNLEVAVAVAEQAVKEGVAQAGWAVGVGLEGLSKVVRERARERIWLPRYADYVYDENGSR
ncbi:hypothetical protein K443DRAFT_114327 [Laccaria amethystina LaAM-08-1]|uniref:Malic enzyme n=1 Tax=Laccaria amethystina LaAM-08-1 TaxID=1095629 RepID=A0A0C9WNI4_9AGAR|nr:hypothetical protein K443DRAFT_114327 [Laccaria amethystina LaAM-08-1]